MSHSLQFLVFIMAGWLNRQQQDLIDYLREENRILREQLGRNTVKRILQDHGIEPAPERDQRTPWKTFLQAHWDWIAAASGWSRWRGF